LLIPFPGFELSSDEDDVSLHPDLEQQNHDVLEKIEEIQSPGLCVYPPTRDIRRGFSAQNGQYLVLQTFTAFKTLYNDRQWHAVP